MTSQRPGPNSAHTADGEVRPSSLVIKQRRLIFANESVERRIRAWEQTNPQFSNELEMWANAQRDGRPAEYR